MAKINPELARAHLFGGREVKLEYKLPLYAIHFDFCRTSRVAKFYKYLNVFGLLVSFFFFLNYFK